MYLKISTVLIFVARAHDMQWVVGMYMRSFCVQNDISSPRRNVVSDFRLNQSVANDDRTIIVATKYLTSFTASQSLG